jgi:hypothetical protein
MEEKEAVEGEEAEKGDATAQGNVGDSEKPTNETTTQQQEGVEKEEDDDDTDDLHKAIRGAFNLPIKGTTDIDQRLVTELEAIEGDLVADLKRINIRGNNKSIEEIRGSIMGESVGFFDALARFLLASIHVYGFADLRRLAREHPEKIRGEPELIQKFLEPPILDSEVATLYLQNVRVLSESSPASAELYHAAMVNSIRVLAHQQAQKVKREVVREISQEGGRRRHASSIVNVERIPSSLLKFDDERSAEELVYAVFINR